MDTLLTQAHSVYAYFNTIPASTWYHLLVFLGTVLSSMGILAALRKRYYTVHNEKMAKHITAILLGAVAFLLNAAQAVVMYGSFNPSFLGQRTADVLGVAFLVYHLGGNKTFVNIRNKLQTWIDNGRAYNAQADALRQSQPVQPTESVDDGQSAIL